MSRGLITSATVIAALVITMAACSQSNPAEPAPTSAGAQPEKLPHFKLRDLQGREFDSATLRGKVTLVNFWATWCKPCEKEMPGLQMLQEKYRERGFAVVGITIAMQMDPDEVAKFAKNHKVTYPLLMGNHEIEQAFDVQGIPATYIADRDGVIRYKVVGFEYTEKVEEALKPLL